ncbi:Histone transcription regulator 3 [Parahypoxylon ruwenzoriense]
MPAFSAINVEPEENIDEEIDNTREIQIDEALKRFQTALKLHAQGPKHYEDASHAYESLFESDIFRYPESATDFERAERQSEPRNLGLDVAFPQSLDVAQADIDGTGSSLPQTLYLAYKNHGQFALDSIKHKIKTEGRDAKSILEDEKVLMDAQRALYEFSAALDFDPSDAELWRRAARVGAFLSSARISRYCLEAAIELDDDPAVEEVEPPSLAEGFAGEQLRRQLSVLSDDLSLSHPIMTPFLKRSIPESLKRHLDPLPFLPNPTDSLASPQTPSALDREKLRRVVVHVPVASWTDLGMSLVHSVANGGLSGEAISFELPEIPDTQDDIQMLVDRSKPEKSRGKRAMQPASEGKPAAQAKDDHSDSPKECSADNGNTAEDARAERSVSILSRKRSQSTAGLPDGVEEEVVDQKRSKRIRRRETAGEAMDTNTQFATQLQPFQAADQNLFQITRNMVENLGVTGRDTLDRLAEVLDSCASPTRTAKLERPALIDLRDSLIKFNEENTRVVLSKKEASSIGFSSFLEHSKPGTQSKPEMPVFHETRRLRIFVERVNAGWMGVQDVAFEWVKHVCATYLTSKWPDAMKTAVVQVISHLDEDIWNRMHYELKHHSFENPARTLSTIDEMIQMLFELHLDVYERITNPSSAVDFGIRVETKGRLGRWFSFASQMSRDRPESADHSLSIRFLWSAVFSVTLTEGVSRDHVLQCWKSLRDRLGEEQESIDIRLPNNAIMPEVSAHAADREISKLTTMDFFLGLFQNDLGDPISVIESLEPVLNPSSVYIATRDSRASEALVVDQDLEEQTSSREKLPISEAANQGLRDLWKFLLGTSTELRLFLWGRLGEAYDAIDYKTKQFSCLLKSIEMIVSDLEQDSYLAMSAEARRPLFLKMLKSLDDSLIQALSMALNDATAFDIIDDEHLQSSMSALAKLCCILHVSCMYEDEVRIGMRHHPSNGATFQSFLTKLREMQVRNWSLLYTMLKAGIAQNKSGFTTPESDLADYLAAIHQVLGLRKFCKASNKIFLKMMRVELLKQNLIDNWEDHLGQVLYDLYGLKLGVGLSEVQDHGCPPEKLERRNTTALVERISVLANRMPMKDLLKSDLKNTIEHMQQAIGQTKSNQQFIQNLRIFNQTLQKPIPPLRLYEALKGNVSMDAVTVNTPDSALAKHRWFFLLGMIAFTKFKGVDLNRRQTPGATDDLRIGATFLRQQLQFTPDQWDAWFRLAECFDYELDESVLWTADKMNKERAELVKYQRSAIHCYTLALSHSRNVLPHALDECIDDIHDLYYKFGMRMYASSREPFAMEPFLHSEHKRFVILESGVESKELHSQMQDYKIWKYAARLFKKAMEVKPKQWQNPYMVAKCIWKMYQKQPLTALDFRDRQDRPTVQTVISALEKAVEVVSALPKPRHGQDPILEPHYKIVSIMHKLLMRGDIAPQEAADVLQRQPYAIQNGEHVEINELEDWEPYVIKTLTHLREKDRSNWQHRIIMRHARILFDENAEEQGYVQAMAAFGVLRESMLTKTMVMNVWKCDAERPGRHHVYTEQYVRFVVKLLVVLKDRTNFEALLRRLRKKGADFYHFNDLWQTCCIAYLRLIRQTYQISPVLEDDFKVTSPEEFDIITSRISDWSSDSSSSHPALSALQETIELKKLNAGLMKAGAIDDLISDCYTALYFEIGKSLPGPAVSALIAEREQARQSDKASEPKPSNPLSSLLNPQSHENSGAEGVAADATPANNEGAQRPRKPGIRRADVLRKAEQAVLRAQEGPRPTSTKSRGSVSSGKTPAADEGKDGDSHGETAPDEDVEMKDEEADGDLSSAPGSVHDSADDESDLSDVPPEDVLDEDEAQQLMFPNLIRRSADTVVDSDASESEGADSSAEEVEEVEEAEETEEGDAE